MVEVEVRRTSDPARPFDAYVNGRYLCTSAMPFRDAAILLMAEGHDPAEILVMSQAGALTCLLAPINYVEAKVTPKFATWRLVA